MVQPTGNIQQRVVIEGEQRFRKALKDIGKNYDKLEVSVDKVARAQTDMGSSMLKINAAFEVVGRLASAASRAIQDVGSQVIDLGMRGGEMAAVSAAFERLGEPGLLGRLQEASSGLLTNMDLMSRSTQVLRTGLVDAEAWATTVESVTRAAQDMHRDVPQALQAVATTLSGGGIESLNQLGVDVLSIRREIALMGDTAESATGRMTAIRLALLQMGEDMGDIDNSASNVNDSWTQLVTTMVNWRDSLAESFAENEELIEFFGDIQEAIEETLPEGEEWGDVLADAVISVVRAIAELGSVIVPATRAGLNFTAMLLEMTSVTSTLLSGGTAPLIRHLLGIEDPAANAAEAMRNASEALEDFDNIVQNVNVRIQPLTENLRNTKTAMDDVARSARAQMAPSQDAVRQSVGAARQEAVQMTDAIRRLAGGFEEAAESSRDFNTTLDEAQQRALIQEDIRRGNKQRELEQEAERERSRNRAAGQRSLQERQRREEALIRATIQGNRERYEFERGQIEQTYETQLVQLDRLMEELDRRLETEYAEIAALEEQAGLIQEQKDLEREAHQERMEGLEEEYAKQQQIREDSRDRAREAAEATSAGLDLIGSAMGESIAIQEEEVANMEAAMEAAGASQAQIAAATKDQVDQIERLKKAEGAFLVAKETVEAAISIADAVRAFANQDYTGGAMHLIAAASHGLAAAMAAARLGGGSASVPAAPTAGSFTPTEPENVDTGTGESEGVRIVNVYSLGSSQEEMGRAMENAQWQRRRVGTAPQVPRGISYD